MRWPLLLTPVLVGMLAAPAGARSRADFAEFAAQEARLVAVSHRLTTASADWCPATMPQPGWLLEDRRRFGDDDWSDAQRVYGATGDGPFIAALVPGSAAERAGLVRGTVIAAINGEPIETPSNDETIRIDAVIVMLAALDPAAPLTVTDGAGRSYRLGAAPGCASAFRVERKGAQAAANGVLVRLRFDLARDVTDEAELAAVVAHELAHNILRHRARLAAASDGRSARLVRATELEADRLSVWLMADAGYDPAAAVRFWTRHKRPLIRAATHPPRKERIAAIEAEMTAMASARAADPSARPPLAVAPPPLE
ncbi:M48 family metallopeptidase [Sphingopyxis flava]|uniref:Peptidase family M48 n=1 Tax=Sphingopyxis flava TaxID=1507287 RepID=A0A1T5DD00_9SPHN|nr:M48 family metallopeptidase [Sphingopyxis flava]SKB69555.1 Peptidase family M48 [Sphingopyxis flava]